jgi:hypothetical protein
MCGGGVRPNKSPHVWSFFTGDQLVSFNLLSSAKPVYLLQNSNFSQGKSSTIIFGTLLWIRIFSTIKNFIFIAFQIYWYLTSICFDQE